MKIEHGSIKLRTPDDWHVHLRDGVLLSQLLRFTAEVFGRGLVMPNLEEAITTAEMMTAYRRLIEEKLELSRLSNFQPLMTVQIIEATTPNMIVNARQAGAVAGKVYPRGMTTNSANGVLNYANIYPALEAMQDCGMVACFHGESPDPKVNPRDRERKFLDTLLQISTRFPRLKIVMEHITDASSIRWVRGLENVAATVTVHHLLITETDWYGGRLRPHLFCKPAAKRFEDRDALVEAALSGDPKFFLGTDSASHPKFDKERSDGCAGIFTAPVALPVLTHFFEQHGALNKLEPFCSKLGAEFYGLPLNEGTITLEKREWTVPRQYGSVVPFMAEETLPWQVVT